MDMEKIIITIGLSENEREVARNYFYKKDFVTIDCSDEVDAESILRTEPLVLVLLEASHLSRDSVRKIIMTIREVSYTPILALSSEANLLSIMRLGVDSCVPPSLGDEVILEYASKMIQRYTSYHTFGMDYPDARIDFIRDLVIDERYHTVNIGSEEIHLTWKEYSLLTFFYHNQGKVLTRDDISKALWPKESNFKRDVAKVVSELRTKLGDNSQNPKYIRTIHGKGYIFLP